MTTARKSALSLIAIVSINTLCVIAGATEGPAPAPSLDAQDTQTQVLGTYQVTGIQKISNGSSSDDCASADTSKNNQRCLKYLWLAKTEKQLAILEAKPADDDSKYFSSGILDGFFIHRSCDTSITKEAAAHGDIFNSNFCRSYLDPRQSSRNNAVFVFGSAVPQLAKLPIEGAGLEMLGILTLGGTHIESTYAVSVPLGEASPKKIHITETVAGSATILSTSFKYVYELTYVAN